MNSNNTSIKPNRLMLVVVLVVMICTTFAVTQQSGATRARIAGLESNARYMLLLSREDSLSHREDSLMVIVQGRRSKIKDAAVQDQNILAAEIRTHEDMLFTLRAQKSKIISEVNNIEQQWVISNLKAQNSVATTSQSPQSTGADNARTISSSKIAIETLPKDDLLNLERSDKLADVTRRTAATYINNYCEMSRLAEEYKQTDKQTQADSIIVEYNKIDSINLGVAKDIASSWSFIADNKSFAYAMLMEKIGANDTFAKEEELRQWSSAEISKLEGQTDARELLEYHVNQLSLVDYEVIVAGKLQLPIVVDSLTKVRDSLRVVEFSYARLSIDERLFIDYEDIKFSSTPHYTAQNPIPEGKIYDRGTIYRIDVGTFQARQGVALFKGAYPICVIKDDKNHFGYYLGGYKTLDEATQAREMLLKRGFKRPEIVEWHDGEMRNLTTDPRPEPTSFRVELGGETQLSEQTMKIIKDCKYELSRTGERTFVVGGVDNRTRADSLVKAIIDVSPASLIIKIIDVE